MTTLTTLRLAVLSTFIAGSLSAATLTFNPSADAGIRSDQPTTTGNSNIFIVGDIANGNALRGVLSFNLATPELVGATINSVSLTLTINDNTEGDGGTDSAVGTVTLNLHALDTSFTETSVTWNTSNGSTTWNAGGRFSTLLSSTSGDANAARTGDLYLFQTTSALVNAVTSVSGTGSLDLLLKLSTEDSTRNIFRFTSRTPTLSGGVTTAFAPTLTIDYTAAIPEPSSAALLGGLAILSFCAIRRRSR
jgi:hypothetical protein